MQKQTSTEMQSEPLLLVKDYATDPNIDRRVKSFLKDLNSGDGPPMEQTKPAEARKVLEGAQNSVKTDSSGVDITEKTITQNGLSVKLFIIRPSGQTAVLPVFMFFHGGGWVLGDFPTHKRLVRDLVVYSGLACVFVEYTRSPEAKYPVALNECFAGAKWVSEHGAEINVDGKRMAVVGNSVGGNLTAAVALMAKENNLDLKFQLLLWPVTNANFETESYNKYATSRFLTKNMMIWFWDNYISKPEHRNEIYASPLKATIERLKGLPPALVQVAENDVLRDEGEAYARKMDEAGVDVTLVRVEGMIHDYGLLNPIAAVPAVQSALRAAAAELKKALQ
ncbi:MAG TPA: alpha/beta hydrolase [Puia sp.]|nr:alpha/beta hydrolase [Puia sp.]